MEIKMSRLNFLDPVIIKRKIMIASTIDWTGENYINKEFTFKFPASFSGLRTEPQDKILKILDSRVTSAYRSHLIHFNKMSEGEKKEGFYKTHNEIAQNCCAQLALEFLQDGARSKELIDDAYMILTKKQAEANKEYMENLVFDETYAGLEM